MTVQDAYEARYAAKLWSLVPAHDRAADSETLDGIGPLQDLLTRIGASMAEVRRSIDRLWEDQSIETCDSWVIAYLADLLATRLVPSMDARGQRLDVANTIGYRRAKGTLGLLERLANDVTGYEARVIEFFRTLSRTRHNLDPAIGRPASEADPVSALDLQRRQRLTGPLTGTPAGGWADLRDPLGASLTGTAFDEYHHLADVRIGRGDLGWHGIAKVGFFLWRTEAMRVDRATPVPVAGCPSQFSFDPTGRQVQLFLAARRGANDYGQGWLPVPLWQLPTPLTEPLWEAIVAAADPVPGPTAYPDPDATSIWPDALSVSAVGSGDVVDLDQVRVWPEVGRFQVLPGGPADVEAGYHHGLFSRIGAGPYDRRRPGVPRVADPLPRTRIEGGSAITLPGALVGLSGQGSVVVGDGRTLTATAPVPAVRDVTIRAEDGERAVIRAAGGAWVFTGAGGRLRLEGLLVSGTDLVLRGSFDEVVISCCTLDPGTSGALHVPPRVWDAAVDGRDLVATTVWIEGSVESLLVERCLTGPIRTRGAGLVQHLAVTDSVVQGLASQLGGPPADDPALAFAAGLVTLTRTTVLGSAAVHRLECSESILDDVVRVANTQDGCVRFSAWSTGSLLPRRYESVEIGPGAPIMVSRRYGEWGYAQLADGADATIRSAETSGAPSLLTGSRDGSEMGAYCRDLAAVKDRSLLIKAREYLPVGLAPVIVHLPEPDPQGELTRGRPWPPM